MAGFDDVDPETLRRARETIADLQRQGYNPRISTAPGSLYRTAAQQQGFVASKKSGVATSLHQNIDVAGKPAALAVHIFDPAYGTDPPRSSPFAVALEETANRHGGITGRKWTDPNDPLHFQTINVRDQRESLRTHIPAYIPFYRGVPAASAPLHLPPVTMQTGFANRPWLLPPHLQLTPPNISSPFVPTPSFKLQPPAFSLPPPLPPIPHYNNESFTGRPVIPSIANFQLQRPAIMPTPFTPVTMHPMLTMPSFSIPSYAPNLGNFADRLHL